VKTPLYSKPSVVKPAPFEDPPSPLKSPMIKYPVISKDKSSVKTTTSESSSQELEEVKSLVVGLGRQNGLHTPGTADNVIKSPTNSKHYKKLSEKKRKRTVSIELDDFAHLSKSSKICHKSSQEKLTDKDSSKVKRKQSINCTAGDSDSGIGGSTKFECPPVLTLARSQRKSLDQGLKSKRRLSASSDSGSDMRPDSLAAERRFSERRYKGEKPYICNHCPLKFSSLQNRVVHERTHQQEKPFECPFCEMRFAVQFNMIRHAKIHS